MNIKMQDLTLTKVINLTLHHDVKYLDVSFIYISPSSRSGIPARITYPVCPVTFVPKCHSNYMVTNSNGSSETRRGQPISHTRVVERS